MESTKCLKCGNVLTPTVTRFALLVTVVKYEPRSRARTQKQAFISELKAWEWINKNSDRLFMTNLGTFNDCACGKIHVGHTTKGKGKRMMPRKMLEELIDLTNEPKYKDLYWIGEYRELLQSHIEAWDEIEDSHAVLRGLGMKI